MRTKTGEEGIKGTVFFESGVSVVDPSKVTRGSAHTEHGSLALLWVSIGHSNNRWAK